MSDSITFGPTPRERYAAPHDNRFDRRLAEILAHATDVFYEKGYTGASMRDLSRATGMSLAGLYYYFESKEKLLYMVQKHTFSTVLSHLHQKLEGVTDPEQRIRIFVRNHLDYFLGHQKGMKVLSHDAPALKGDYATELLGVRRHYYHTLRQMADELRRKHGLEGGSTRIAVLSLFGMMNWIHTWYKPKVDGDADELARQMSNVFLHGILNSSGRKAALPAAAKTQNTAARRPKAASSKS